MRVWLLQTGEYLPYVDEGNRPMRAANLVRALEGAGHEVTLWTADFIHHELRHRYRRDTILRASSRVELRFVHSPGYGRNVGLGRLFDHARLGANLRERLRAELPPDVAFVGFPPVEAAAVMVSWLRQNGVPTVIDVKDQWPETLLRPLPSTLKPAARLALGPYYRMARNAIRDSDRVASLSGPFLDWSLRFAGRERTADDLVLPLTMPKPEMSAAQYIEAGSFWDNIGVEEGETPRVVFAGRMGTHLDLAPVLSAAARVPQWQFVLSGSGPLLGELERNAGRLPNVVVTGWLNQAQLAVLHERATAVLIPYRNEEAFTLSLPNKAIDAMAYGRPLLTGLDGHLPRLIQEHGIGAKYGPHRPLESILLDWAEPNDVTQKMGLKSGELYIDEYSYDHVYGGLVSTLESMTRENRAS